MSTPLLDRDAILALAETPAPEGEDAMLPIRPLDVVAAQLLALRQQLDAALMLVDTLRQGAARPPQMERPPVGDESPPTFMGR